MSGLFILFNADDGKIKVSMRNQSYEESGERMMPQFANTSEELVKILKGNHVSIYTDRLAHSSDVDFASEEGFADDKAAHRIIDEAIRQLDMQGSYRRNPELLPID